jgi:peptide/nickel transport system permease protein
MVMLGLTLALILVTPLLPFYDPYVQDLARGLAAPLTLPGHLLGTDALGRDILSRLALAARVSLLIAGTALAASIVVGVALGLVAGYFGGWAEALIMGAADLRLSIPIILLIVMVIAVAGPGIATLIAVLAFTYWVGYARLARSVALAMRDREFVLAAQTFGASAPWILRVHLLPQIVPQLAIVGSLDLGALMILESGLSYLGLGVQPPVPSLGGMISEGQDYLQTDPWLCILPGLVIWLLVGSVQILSQRLTSEGGSAGLAAGARR